MRPHSCHKPMSALYEPVDCRIAKAAISRLSDSGALALSKGIPTVNRIMIYDDGVARFSVLPSHVSAASMRSKLKLDVLKMRGVVRLSQSHDMSFKFKCVDAQCRLQKSVPRSPDGSKTKARRTLVTCDHVQTLRAQYIQSFGTGEPSVLEEDEDFAALEAGNPDRVLAGMRSKAFTSLSEQQAAKLRQRDREGWWAKRENGPPMLPLILACICPPGLRCMCGANCDLCGSAWDGEQQTDATAKTLYAEYDMFKIKAAGYRCSNTACKGVLQYDGDGDGVIVTKEIGARQHAMVCT